MDGFGQLVKHKRMLKKLSSRELSRTVGMSSAYVSQLERGLVKRPDYDVAKRLADVLEIEDSVLQYYGFVPVDVLIQSEQSDAGEIERRRQMEEAYASNLSEQVKTMDLESLETVSYIVNQQMNLAQRLYELSRIGDRQSIATITEFVDYLHTKHFQNG